MKRKEYPCKLSPTGLCRYGGNKSYGYGFVSGTASFCYKDKIWLHDVTICPLIRGGEEMTQDNPETPTLRDQFAMVALTGFIAHYGYPTTDQQMAEGVYTLADAMLEARKK